MSLHWCLTSFGERIEMKSSYILRTFSSTTVLLVSFLSSSQASQNIMFSSLNSVRRKCLKQLRPAALFITFSNVIDQARASSRVGFGLKNKGSLLFYSPNNATLYAAFQCFFENEDLQCISITFLRS